MTDRLTKEEMLETRLNGIERQLELLEEWTGIDIAEGPNDPTIADQVRGMTEVIRYLIMYIELLTPGFSARQLREDIHIMRAAVMDLAKKTAGSTIDDEALKELDKQDAEIIDRCFLQSIYEDGSHPTGPFPAGLQALIRARRGCTQISPDDA